MLEVIFIKIKEAHVYGFGKWVDYTIDFSRHDFLAIYGGNESGKSTLQQFILFILFGFPPKQRAFYRPKTSGKMGGRLVVSDASVGDYVIERMDDVNNGAATCYTSDGKEHGDKWLHKQLKGMTAEVYQSIFTFSALDLNHFHLMKDDDLGEVILGVGLSGSNNIYEIEKQLDTELDKLFKRSGRVPIINKQLTTLDQRFAELAKFKQNEATYRDKQQALTDLNEDIDESQRRVQEAKERYATLERKQNNIDVINDYHVYENQLSALGMVTDFPEDGINRLNALKNERLPLESEQSILSNTFTQQEKDKDNLTEQLLTPTVYEDGQKILTDYEQYRLTEQAYFKQQKESDVVSSEITQRLSELNMSINEDTLRELSFPFYIENVWNDLKQTAEQHDLTEKRLNEEKSTLEKQQVNLTEQEEAVQVELLTPEEVAHLHKQRETQQEQAYFTKYIADANEKQAQWEVRKQAKMKQLMTTLIISVLSALLLGGIGLLLDMSVLYSIMIILILFGLGQYVWGQRSIKETDDLLRREDVSGPNLNQVTAHEAHQAQEQLEKQDEYRSMLASIKEQMKALHIERIKWDEKNNTFQQQVNILQAEIEEQERIYPFLTEIELNYWPEFYQKIKQLLDLQQTRKSQTHDTEALKASLAAFDISVNNYLQANGHKEKPINTEAGVKMVREMIQDHQNTRFKLEQLVANQTEVEEKLTELTQRIQTYEAEIEKLYELADVTDEEDFYKKAKQVAEQDRMQENLTQTVNHIQHIFSEAEAKKLIKEKPDQSRLEVELSNAKVRIRKLEQSIDDQRHQLAAVITEINQMESSESYSNTMHQFTMEQEELANLAEEWSVLKVAKEMLAETKRQYRDKYLTKIIQKTSDYFNYVTAESYTRVIAPQETNLFQVETSDHMRYDVNELSQGTVDQLYICLRLAISEIMSDEHQVPFIIDDAFVHFDSNRTSNMLDILIDISERQQVIYFTCKKTVIEKLPKNHVLTLSDAG